MRCRPASRGEIIEGVLYTMTRPRGPHQSVEAEVVADLVAPFRRGRGGPGGWWILPIAFATLRPSRVV